MKVLYLAHAHVGLVKTGLYGQIQRTADAVRELGVEVVLLDPWEDQLADVDVCHFFSVAPEMWFFHHRARNRGVPCIFSPVLNVADQSLLRLVVSGRLGGRVPGMLSGWKHVRDMLRHAARILPLTRHERRIIRLTFGVPDERMRIVPNGVDKGFAEGDPELFRRKHGLGDYVLNVGYIGRVKNQLNLIRAMKGSPMHLVLVGEPRMGEAEYLEACKREAGDRVLFTGRLPYGSPMLLSAYAGAKVFALPSFTEVMSIALMEAALAGCRLVASVNVPIVDYLEPYVHTARASRPGQIRKAIDAAAAEPGRSPAREVMLGKPTWSEVGRMIVEEYERSLTGRGGGDQ